MDESRIPNRIEQILSERLPEQIGTVRDFERWFESSLKLRIMVAVERVHHAAAVALDAARQEVLKREGVVRDVWFVTGGPDGRSLMKSVASIRSKLGRELCEREDDDRLSLDQGMSSATAGHRTSPG